MNVQRKANTALIDGLGVDAWAVSVCPFWAVHVLGVRFLLGYAALRA